MTDRKTASTITDRELDELYNDLAALREVARSYCPHCGRGDATPTVADWEQQKQRADQAETETARVRALHHPVGVVAAAEFGNPPDCAICGPNSWPCPTTRALDGPTPITGADGHIICTCTHGTPCGCGTSPHYQQPAPAKPSGFRPYQPADIPRTGNPDHTLVVEPYRNDWREHVWAFRCWGTPTCDGWLSLDHSSQQSAERARDRHVAEQHSEPAAPAATQTTDGSCSVSAPGTEPNNREQP